jgi:alkylhydroperoxidase/carboxymuconolactone decarboxylase family protein YurZ
MADPQRSLSDMLGFTRSTDPKHRQCWDSELSEPFRSIIRPTIQDVWSRPQLSLKVRCLVNVATLASTGRPEVRQHIECALLQGNAPEEIVEVLLHTALYAGVPLAVDALEILVDVVQSAQ